MKLISMEKSEDQLPSVDYSAEFECISTFLTYFKDAPGLTDRQVLSRALKIASETFRSGSSLTIEKTGRQGCFALVAMGVDPHTGRVLSRPSQDRPVLRVVR